MKRHLLSAAFALAVTTGLACASTPEQPASPAAEASAPPEAEAAAVQPAPEEASVAAAPAHRPAGEAAVGDRSTCPVTGDQMVIDEETPRFDYQGRTFYVCCEGCLDDLKADPEKFLRPHLQ